VTVQAAGMADIAYLLFCSRLLGREGNIDLFDDPFRVFL
jgi:hypothetical protein